MDDLCKNFKKCVYKHEKKEQVFMHNNKFCDNSFCRSLAFHKSEKPGRKYGRKREVRSSAVPRFLVAMDFEEERV